MGFLDKLFKTKKIYEYKPMEKVKIDIDAALNNPSPKNREYCKLFAETNEYNFYMYEAYSDESGGYVLRQRKSKPKDIVFLGNHKQLACVFEDFLFQTEHTGERGRFYIQATNIENGVTEYYDWLGKGNHYITPGGYGRFYCQDIINEMYVENKKLIFNITRIKSNTNEIYRTLGYKQYVDEYDYDMDYKLEVTLENGAFYLNRHYPPQKSDTSENN